jgi:deazaflavin-dependent oxidoreductase (nitroreductase family)
MAGNEWNDKVIAEFRERGGKVGGNFEGAPMLLLHSTGAKSGEERVSPMMYQDLGDAVAVFASNAGRDPNPNWYFNLTTNPDAEIELGTETRQVTAREATGDERERIWSAQTEAYPGFKDYELRTTRVIPVFVLDPR